MGIFDNIFGRNADKSVKTSDDQQRFNQLRQKYTTALNVADQQGVRLTNLHLQDDKLYFKGIAPNDQAKNAVWDQIKLVDSNYSDLVADINVQQQQSAPASTAAPAAQNKTYTVQSGDTLSRISREQYGDANEYMRIFYANRDKLNDPDKIQVGQVLTIPPDDDN
jgi:nucleoid-associated protein YgaU